MQDQYAFISCWYGTWLLFSPPHDRCMLYISNAFLATSSHSTEKPTATTRGSVSWLQCKALRDASQPVAFYQGDTNARATRVGNTGAGHEDDTAGPRDAGAQTGSNEVYEPGSSG